jgi:hypothetical protein
VTHIFSTKERLSISAKSNNRFLDSTKENPLALLLLEYALSLARDLAHSWPSWLPSILFACNSSIRL